MKSLPLGSLINVPSKQGNLVDGTNPFAKPPLNEWLPIQDAVKGTKTIGTITIVVVITGR